jgi:hypothetical protein
VAQLDYYKQLIKVELTAAKIKLVHNPDYKGEELLPRRTAVQPEYVCYVF